jgi:hypothetical protein
MLARSWLLVFIYLTTLIWARWFGKLSLFMPFSQSSQSGGRTGERAGKQMALQQQTDYSTWVAAAAAAAAAAAVLDILPTMSND